MDYPDPDFTKLKYTDAYLLLIRRGQSYLDLCTDLLSWLHSEIFCHWIRNSVSPASKYSKLLASHCGDLRSEGHLYPYLFGVTLDSRVLQSWSYSIKYTLTFHLHAIPTSPRSLVKRTTNLYGTQRPTLDISIILVIAYHLIMNSFED